MAAPPGFEIEPIRATRTFEAAIEHLTEAVERAGLRTGDRLPNETDLAARLGISKPTQQADRRVAVARKDPVALLERVYDARLDRLVPAEDRVRADASLAVVHDRALVVGAEEDERAVDGEQCLVVEPVHAAVGLAVEADHAAQALLDHGRALHL